MLIALLVPITLATVAFAIILIRAVVRQRAVPNLESVVLGAITNFFDTLGIGSFAPTTAWFKFRKLVPDRLIPPTMRRSVRCGRPASLIPRIRPRRTAPRVKPESRAEFRH